MSAERNGRRARGARGRGVAGGAARGAPAPADRPRPTREADVWDTLPRWRAERRRFVLATVTGARGFTPRKPGAHMLVAEDGATCGTIGGGAIEHAVLAEAAALFARGGTALVERHLTQELGMCCGGAMSVFLEVVEPAPQLVVFGAGYIAKPLAAIAAGCGFEVTVVDERPAWANEERFPTAAVRLEEAESFARALAPRGEVYAVVVTHDHALDQKVVQHLLRKPLRFVGMIGSVPKQRKFALRLRARGFADAEIARLRTPLGLAIGAATPEEIAVSVAAELVAVRRGAPVEPGWTPPPRADDAATGSGPHSAGEAGRDGARAQDGTPPSAARAEGAPEAATAAAPEETR
uniref:Xanthine dehydrogenase accessory protein XdhC n=1 Tax=Eiseniibacteriota bacterium TaxID=2212470 RepID=A0A832I242_UNCEI